MPTRSTANVIERLRASVLPHESAESGDGELLRRFVEHRDEAALAALVRAHGPMVWGVCRRMLNHHDAEDAFQAAFLVLVRKAPSVTPREMVGNWLYGVAHQSALQARRTAARRRAREVQVTEMPDAGAARDDLFSDLQPVLDDALSALPDNYRAVVVLCDLEGRTRRQVANQLGVPEGTVAGRLARARALLAKRLARRGVNLSAAALTALLTHDTASAGVPHAVVSNTIGAAKLLALGQETNTAAISPAVAALTEGVLKVMLIHKLKTVVAVALVLGLLATAATAFTDRIAYAGEYKLLAPGDKLNAPPRLERAVPAPPDLTGMWRGDDWGTVVLRPAKDGGFEGTYSDTFGTAEGRIAVRWSQVSRRYEGTWSEGTYRFGRIALDAPKVGAVSGAYTTDPKCEHQPGVPALASLKWNKKPADEENAPVTAWGKEVGGLQAGIAFVPANAHRYRPGETVKLAVQLRNVGAAPITITHGLLHETAPRITDARGQRVWVTMPPHLGIIVIPTERELKAGETITLYTPEVALGELLIGQIGPEQMVGKPTIRVRPGKYRIAFGGMVQSHPTLATGATEFEVQKPAKPESPPKEPDPVEAEVAKLQGEWGVVALESGGRKAPADELNGMRWAIQGDVITGTDPDGSTGKMSFRLNPKKTPKEIDITSLDGNRKGSTALGIYKLEDGKFRVCLGEKVRPKEFATKAGDDIGLITLEQKPLTAWGKEINGLQAGIGLPNGQKRDYQHGDTITLVVRVRNVGKEAVKFSYLQPFTEHAPTVTDKDGRSVPQPGIRPDIGERLPGEVELAPGKEIELHELKRQLRSTAESNKKAPRPYPLDGNGKIGVRYEQVYGAPELGARGWKLDPTLSKLATGTLELDVRPGPAANDKK